MVSYETVKEIERRLLKISELTLFLKKGSGFFFEAALRFLEGLQQVADENKLYVSCDIALAQEKMLTYCGEPHTSEEGYGRKNLRKEKDAYAAKILEGAAAEIKKFIAKERSAFDECAELWRQIAARLIAKGMDLSAVCESDRAASVYSAAGRDAEITPYFAHVTGLAGARNALQILSDVLPEMKL